MMKAPAVIVHGLAMARQALAPGLPVTLLSAEGAAAFAGVGWWQALVGLARASYPATPMQDILDCGDAPGRALEALRARQALLVLRAEPRIRDDIAGRAAAQGGVLLRDAPPALDLAQPRATLRLAAWLGTGTRGPDDAFG
jgi:hypothetical protein